MVATDRRRTGVALARITAENPLDAEMQRLSGGEPRRRTPATEFTALAAGVL